MEQKAVNLTLGTFGAWIMIFIVCGGLYGCPRYNVWKQEMNGRAEFARAEQNRQILIETAKAKKEAAIYEAEAEHERAKGMKKAIEEEAGALTPEYIQYLWVRQQGELNNKTVVYIPTEANLPILENIRLLNQSK